MDIITADLSHRIDDVVALLRKSSSILFITGAGLSADSGLPTYRGIGGLYEGKDTEENLPIEAMLSGEMLRTRPELTWKYLMQIEQACRATGPTRGHHVIREMEHRFPRVWVLTQNVDGFHRKAGTVNLIDMHGDFQTIRCTRCTYEQTVENYAGLEVPPRCPHCRSIVRPDVVLFGEMLPSRQLATYQAELSRGFDLVFSIGTTSVFPYIAGPVLDAYHLKRPSVEINPGLTDVSEFVTVQIPLRAAVALDEIWRRFQADPQTS